MRREESGTRLSRAFTSSTTLMAAVLSGLLFFCVSTFPAAAQSGATEERAGPSLTGEVKGTNGRPVAGARVLAAAVATTRRAERPRAAGVADSVAETVTGPDGGFRLDIEDEGRHVLLVSHPEYSTAFREGVEAGRHSTIVLERGFTLVGRVYDAASGRPLAGIEIEAGPVGGGGPDDSPFVEAARHLATSDDTGTFRIARLEQGFYQIAAVADGFARTVQREVKVTGNGPSSPPADLYLAEGIALSGRVLDGAGSGVANALVRASPGGMGPELLRQRRRIAGSLARVPARTADDGSFVIDGLPPLPDYVLEVTHEDLAPSWHEIEIGSGRVDPVKLRVGPGGSVSGRLMFDEETPFTGEIEAEVQLESGTVRTFRPRPRTVRRTADEIRIDDGAFDVDRLPAGEVTLILRPEGRSALRRERVRIVSGEVQDLGVIQFEGGPSIRGTVADDLGDSVAGARVTVSGSTDGRRQRKTATSDSRGRFTVGGLPADSSFRVTVTADDLAVYVTEEVVPDTESVAAVLQHQGRVSARVVAGEPAAPVFGIRVSSYAKETNGEREPPWRRGGWGADPAESFRDRSGAFTIELVPGTYTVKIEADGYVPARVENVTVRPDEELRLGDVRLDRGVPLEGVVADGESGAAIPNASVTIESAGTGRFRRGIGGQDAAATAAVTDPAGRFSFAGLPPGVHALRVDADGFAPQSVDVAIEPGVPADSLRLELSRGGWIEGYVRDKETGEVLPGAIVSARVGFGAGMGDTTATDDTGYYLLQNLPPGTYRVSVMPQSAAAGDFRARMDRMQTESAAVRDGGTTVVDFPPSTGSIVLSGTLLKGTEPIAARLIFSLSGSGGFIGTGFASTSSEADGTYEVTLARTGDYDVRVMPMATDDRRSVSFRRSYNLSAEVKEGIERLDLEVGENALSGRALDVDTGDPLTAVTIVAHRVDEGGLPLSDDRPDAMARTEEDGSFSVEGLATGEYRVWFVTRGYFIESTEDFDVDEDDRVDDLDVLMTPFAPVGVAVFDDAGVPVEGAFVTPLGIETMQVVYQFSGLTDVDGLAELEALPRGGQAVGVVSRGYAPRVVDVDPDDPDRRAVRVQLSRGQPVRIEVVDQDESPLEGAIVTIAEDRGEDLTRLLRQVQRRRGSALTTGDDGGVVLPNLEPGRYVVEVVQDGRRARDTIEVRAGEEAEFELTIR